MKVKLELENVGGLRGNHSFEFETGRVNILEAPNAVGKSSIIRGLAAVLSAPFIGSLAESEAEILGLSPEALINVYEDEATVRLRMNGEIKELRIRRDGRLLKNPHGDNKFLFAGLLAREAKLMRNLLTGHDDFYWIVSIMSLADEFKKVSDIIERKLTEVSLKIEELKRRIEDQKQLREELTTLETEKRKLEKEYESLQEELSLISTEDPILMKFSKEIEQLRRREKEIKKSINGLMKTLEREEKNLREVQREYKEQKNKYEKLKEEIRHARWKLASISPDEIGELERVAHISKTRIETLREERTRYEVELNLYTSALQSMDESLEKVTCPLCMSGVIPIREIKERIEKLRKKISEVNLEIDKAMRTYDESLWKRDQIIKEMEDLKNKINSLENELKSEESDLHRLEGDLNTCKRVVENKEKELKTKYDELKLIQEKLVKKYKEKEDYEEKHGKKKEKLTDKLSEILKRTGEVEHRVQETKDKLSEISYEYIIDTSINIDHAIQIYETFRNELEATLEDLRKITDKERRGVAREFNRRIREILDKLGFKEFEEISLNEDTYKLQVYRQGGKYQPIASLSTSERSAIVAVLQIAMKMTYLPENPCFIIDAVALDFDENKVTRILNYLSKLAKERDWLIILTKLSEKESLAVHIYEPNA